ncbi:hypothetical protein PR048_025043 [Dryococelus australis]|uniref:Uncharacterized protein n=1 Tax=Dryococelus australis TaxID=614101 RepID=A0ABQ9GQ91_9NEOP|nr:hypothetical protein PR048_025043 [Dryococelus australis]
MPAIPRPNIGRSTRTTAELQRLWGGTFVRKPNEEHDTRARVGRHIVVSGNCEMAYGVISSPPRCSNNPVLSITPGALARRSDEIYCPEILRPQPELHPVAAGLRQRPGKLGKYKIVPIWRYTPSPSPDGSKTRRRVVVSGIWKAEAEGSRLRASIIDFAVGSHSRNEPSSINGKYTYTQLAINFTMGGRVVVVVRLLDYHKREPGSISGEVASRIFARGNRGGRCLWSAGVSRRFSRFAPHLHFRRWPILTLLHTHRLSRPRCQEPPKYLRSLTLHHSTDKTRQLRTPNYFTISILTKYDIVAHRRA